MIEIVIKADGSEQPFEAGKLNRWIEYGRKKLDNMAMSMIGMTTVSRLPKKCKSSTIQQMLIDVCIEQEELQYSRMAARLELAVIRKHMDRHQISDKEDFTEIMTKLIALGIWDADALPSVNRDWNQWVDDG